MYSVSEVASRLGVSDRRVRALIDAGRLPARRVGRSWVVEPSALFAVSGVRSPGRPLSAERAWAELLGDEQPPPADEPMLRSRYRGRSARHFVEAPDVSHALRDPTVAVGGWDAAVPLDRLLDPVVDSDAPELRVIYIGRSDIKAWRARHWVVDATVTGVMVHVIEQPIAERIAAAGALSARAVAVDLAEVGGQRRLESALRIWR